MWQSHSRQNGKYLDNRERDMNITMGWAARTAIAATLVALPALAIAQSATVTATS